MGDVMQGYYEETKLSENGIVYPFRSYRNESVGEKEIICAHYHESIELLYCLEGSYELLIDGTIVDLNKGDLFVVNSMEMHSVKAVSKESNIHYAVLFKPELLYSSAQTVFEMKYILPFTMRLRHISGCFANPSSRIPSFLY